MRNYKNSIRPEDARKDFRTRMRSEMLPDVGHQKGRCGTINKEEQR